MLSESEDTCVIKNGDILHLPTTLLRFAQLGFCKCKALHFSSFISSYFLLFIMIPSFLIFAAMVLVLSCNSHFIVLCSFFTNALILPIVNGPTEGLMLIYLCHFFTFFTGAEWWAQDFQKSMPLLGWVPLIPEIPVYDIVLCLMIAFAVIPTIGSNIHNVYRVVEARKGSMVLALAMLFPFGLLLAGVLVWSYLSPSDIMRNQPHLLIIGTGFAFGFLVGRMILAHLCDVPKGLKTGMCMSLAYFPFAIANALTAWLDDGNPLVGEQLVLLMYCLFTVAMYMHFATSVIHEITNALGIHFFRITRKKA
ncbi:hypothetical protein GQ55_1G013300 [Panicum hallii var. hallii]|uniref:Uncharacterized protein n=1 Tax=Panicum hallii var. hallii TaxID=1504633 RepID=A0A2T7F0Z1_9POAL|nr:hypothetical protein GQ55_1G013300 [Panicum hallii var. hallii]